jgi:ATP-dependent Clp protease ATP-binding subunit ClpC
MDRFWDDPAFEPPFTDRPRRLLQQALAQAQREKKDLASDDILLAIVVDGSSVPAIVLTKHGVRAAKLRRMINGIPSTDKQLGDGELAARQAVEEAVRLGCNYVGTEHLLLGILHDKASSGARLLKRAGLEYEGVRAELWPYFTHCWHNYSESG